MKKTTKAVAKPAMRNTQSLGTRKQSAKARETVVPEQPERSESRRAGSRKLGEDTPGPALSDATAASGPMATFHAAAELFHAGRFSEARRLFEQVSGSAGLDLAHAARSYIKMCDARLSRQGITLSTPEEYYAYGVAMVNQGKYAEAKAALETAARLAPEADHIHYALSLCLGLAGDIEGSAQSLRRAIALQPRNRVAAKSDPDFADLLRKPAIAEVLRQ